MPIRAPLISLAALLLAGAALVGCGGGDAEPPPPPVGPAPAGPDTTAPTVQIANNVSAPTATGPVTFTFVFSEDVGTSFDASDITVAGGTVGAFTRVGGTQATLVVTPPTGTGTITVSVAAGSVTDLAGNANAAAAQAAKDYAVSGGGGGGGTAPDLVFSSGLASTTRTIEGGELGGFSGSNVDGFNCGAPAACGGGGDFPPALAAADSYFFYYYQTPTPATDLYMGIYLLAPGVVGPLSDAADHAGVQINGQTAIRFKVGQNPEWFGTATNRYAVNLQLGKRYVAGGGACRIQLRTIVTPTAQAATEYTVPFSAFSVVQDCGQGFSVAQALADSPITQVTFQAGAGGPAQSAGGQSTGANLTVAAGGVYPTTLVVVGGITFVP